MERATSRPRPPPSPRRRLGRLPANKRYPRRPESAAVLNSPRWKQLRPPPLRLSPRPRTGGRSTQSPSRCATHPDRIRAAHDRKLRKLPAKQAAAAPAVESVAVTSAPVPETAAPAPASVPHASSMSRPSPRSSSRTRSSSSSRRSSSRTSRPSSVSSRTRSSIT